MCNTLGIFRNSIDIRVDQYPPYQHQWLLYHLANMYSYCHFTPLKNVYRLIVNVLHKLRD